ncbi:MAG: DUF411 domain-containing protein [Rhodospirillales bacterium]|nr:DUF411 domain-containing protein [Rhodospirillales bacterium]
MSLSKQHSTTRKPPPSPSGKGLLRKRNLLWGAAALVPAGAAVALWPRHSAGAIKATLYKNPQCTCCEGYASYLTAHGFDVDVIPSNDLVSINRQHGMPEALDGCHTTLTSGYVVIGHIPIEMVQRLLAEKPEIIGISLPGMPSGTPGMGGPKEGPLTIYALGKAGQSVFATV